MRKIAALLSWVTLLAFSHQGFADIPPSTRTSPNIQCSASGSGDLLYARFYQLWSEDTGIKDGIPTAKIRVMTPSEKSEALDCLKKADALNNCKAIHVLELFYRFGISEKDLGIRKDMTLADKYLERKKIACKH
jgi:hypothetical protein